ncbi:MAG TPA: PKD domain-containing protein, partial [Bacteroidales bacterium]|nr:PKD domain-containing protein [Bacteroidales bacterium]
PTVFYPSQGSYGVGLTVFDGIETHSVYFPNFILVGLDFLMTNGSATVCSAIFYDSGGAQGNYFPNENSTFTFFPGHAAAKIKAVFTHFDVEAHATCNFDWLKAFNGTNISAPLLGTWCGTNSPGTIIATNASGALTFQFKSDNSANRSGWVADISCVYPIVSPVANFIANQTQLIQGDTIQFSDLTTGYPETWMWSFPGGTPSLSASPNPTVIYQTPGVYDVTLTVTNNIGSNTKTIVNYIHVDTGTSIVDPYLKKKVYVSPNPVTGGQVKIKSDYTMEVLEIISLTGQKALQVRPQSNNILLDVSELKNGFYILVIRGSAEKWVQKLIIY